MDGHGLQGGEPPSIERRVQELEGYCHPDFDGELSLEGVRERVRGIPPEAVRGSPFFHDVCQNKGVSLEIVECLLCAFPGAARSTSNGDLPLHVLALNADLDEATANPILSLLLAEAPQSVAGLGGPYGSLPIHEAAFVGQSDSFCKRLIDAYPESLRVPAIASRSGVPNVDAGPSALPIHCACGGNGNIETVKYMIELYPESISARDGDGNLPIHSAAAYFNGEIVKYLLAKDPDGASKTGLGRYLPLHLACESACLEAVRLLFDAYPEAINARDGLWGGTPLDLVREEEAPEVVEFLEAQLPYARQAEDIQAMCTPDQNGWLPLHRALRDNASLGAIKLLIKGNPSALPVADNRLAFPLHIACQFCAVGVVQYLLGLLDVHLHALDLQKDSTLHYACRGGNLGVVKYLLERGVPSVSEPNSDGKLPIHLLWESDRIDRESLEYVEANWLLLLAYPETVTHD